MQQKERKRKRACVLYGAHPDVLQAPCHRLRNTAGTVHRGTVPLGFKGHKENGKDGPISTIWFQKIEESNGHISAKHEREGIESEGGVGHGGARRRELSSSGGRVHRSPSW